MARPRQGVARGLLPWAPGSAPLVVLRIRATKCWPIRSYMA